MIRDPLCTLVLIGLCACGVDDVIAVQGGDASTCEGDNAAWLAVGDTPCDSGRSVQFRHAICSCEGSVVRAPITTLISQPGASPFGAAIAWNGRVDVSAAIAVAGDVVNASSEGLVGAAPGAFTVAGSLRSAGPIDGTLDFDIAGDAHVNGPLQAHDLVVAGTLYTPEGSAIAVTGVDDATRRESAAVDVSAPCGCDSASQHDIAAYVSAAADDNDNALIDLDPRALENAQTTRMLQLPCGRFYLSAISGASDVQLVVDGRSALFIDGDIALERSLTITIVSGSLDLFVAGNVTIADALAAGDQTAPVRMYVGGSGTLDLSRNAELGGFLYAPRSELVARESLRLWGPLFVRRLSNAGEITIHYDASLFDVTTPQCR